MAGCRPQTRSVNHVTNVTHSLTPAGELNEQPILIDWVIQTKNATHFHLDTSLWSKLLAIHELEGTTCSFHRGNSPGSPTTPHSQQRRTETEPLISYGPLLPFSTADTEDGKRTEKAIKMIRLQPGFIGTLMWLAEYAPFIKEVMTWRDIESYSKNLFTPVLHSHYYFPAL